MTATIKEIDCIRVKGSSREKLKERITVESHMTLYVNDEVASEFILTAGLEEQLAVGYLLSTGAISSFEQIESIKQTDNECRVWTNTITQPSEIKDVKKKIDHDILLEVREALTKNQKNHFATRGFHGAIIWEIPTSRWFMCEDIGRHNAVDKVIGYGKQEGYDLSQSMILLSGRLVSNIVSKCVNSQIPMITSMTVATDKGIEMAREANITIVGSLSEDGFWLYNEGAVEIT